MDSNVFKEREIVLLQMLFEYSGSNFSSHSFKGHSVSRLNMESILKYTKTLLLICVVIMRSTATNKCQLKRPMSILPSYRCMVQNTVYANITRLHPYSCRYYCMMKPWCSVINENVVNNFCLLSNGPCMGLIPDHNFHGIYFKTADKEECLVWKSNRESLDPATTSNPCMDRGVPSIVGRFNEHPMYYQGILQKTVCIRRLMVKRLMQVSASL